jgi:NADH:ubiquinone oxidoreductase subunit 2 (subunit N)
LTGLFFVIELQSLSLYILVSSKQTSSLSTESGLKYFILGCFSSGLMLFGISLIYGFTGLLSYDDLSLYTSTGLLNISNSYVNFFTFFGFVAGLLFLTIGILFKLGAAPFHM